MIYTNENFDMMNESTFSNPDELNEMNESNQSHKTHKTKLNIDWLDFGRKNMMKKSNILTEENLQNRDNFQGGAGGGAGGGVDYDSDESSNYKKRRKRSISTETLFENLISEDFNNLNINPSKNNSDYSKLLLEINEKIDNIGKNIGFLCTENESNKMTQNLHLNEYKKLTNVIQEELTAKISKINKVSIDGYTKINIKFDQLQNKFDKILVEKEYTIDNLKDEISSLKDEIKSLQYNNNYMKNNDHYC